VVDNLFMLEITATGIAGENEIFTVLKEMLL
jgi:hypothetical protein